MALYQWSTTAASNATADATINWAEGQAPSSVNDSARAMMAAIAVARRDTQAVTGAGGTSSAFTFTSNQTFSSLSAMDGQLITFVAPSTNAAGVTLNVDGLGAKTIYMDASSTVLPAGVLVGGTPYMVTYYNSVSQFRIWNLFADPFNIPLGGAMAYFGTTAPNSNFVFPYGQAISRTTYATLFTLFGTTYGVGDGSTTFNIPDLRGRGISGKDDMGGTSANRLTALTDGVNGDTLGAAGGLESTTLTTAQIPSHTHVNTLTDPGHAHNYGQGGDANGGSSIQSARNGTASITTTNTTGITITNASAGGGGAHNNVQPTIIGNYILRII